MFKWIQGKFTNNLTEIPLFYVNFNFKYYEEYGKRKSCVAHIHPILKDDEIIINKLNELIDYIRDNYDMNEI